MVRCMLNGKVYETCRPEETESDDETSRATKIIEHEFDETGRARVKVVYVDAGEFKYDYPEGEDSEADASMHIEIIISREEEKERMEGTSCPLLIFVLQDRDYWPGSDNEPGVMARRASKEKAYNEFKSYMPRPDTMDIYVPPMTKHHDPSLGSEIGSRTGFWEPFDPSLPVNKYILANMDDIQRTELNEGLLAPDILREWNERMGTTQVDKALDGLHISSEYL